MTVLNEDVKVLNLLGLATKAHKTVRGEDNVIKAMQQGKVKMVFIASDASERTKDQFSKKCFFYSVDVNFDFTCGELSSAIGRGLCKIIAINDQGFYKTLKNILNRGDQE